MPYLNNFIRCCRLEVCGNEEELDRYLQRIIHNKYREEYSGLKSELKEILDNDKFDYLHFLENDEYEVGLYGVDVPENQYQAKKFIIDYIWNKLYPDDRIDI